MRDLRFCYITCVAVDGIVYWPSNPRHEIIYTRYASLPKETAKEWRTKVHDDPTEFVRYCTTVCVRPCSTP